MTFLITCAWTVFVFGAAVLGHDSALVKIAYLLIGACWVIIGVTEWKQLPIGTKSVLIGAHCFAIHWFFVARGWTKLYGWTWDGRVWAAWALHDIGYWGKPNLDGPEGESHPEVGARIMHWLFDGWIYFEVYPVNGVIEIPFGAQHVVSHATGATCRIRSTEWQDLCLHHSRYYCKKSGAKPSKLCFADKLVPCFEPAWLYLPRVTLTGEIEEFLDNAQKAESIHWRAVGRDKKLWYAQLQKYMFEWVAEHKDGAEDTWTNANRNKRAA